MGIFCNIFSYRRARDLSGRAKNTSGTISNVLSKQQRFYRRRHQTLCIANARFALFALVRIHVVRHPWFQSITRHLTTYSYFSYFLDGRFKNPAFWSTPPLRPFAKFNIHCCARTVFTGPDAARRCSAAKLLMRSLIRDIYDSSSLTGCCNHLSLPRVASMTDDGNPTLSSPRPLEATAVGFRDEKSVNNRPSLQQDLYIHPAKLQHPLLRPFMSLICFLSLPAQTSEVYKMIAWLIKYTIKSNNWCAHHLFRPPPCRMDTWPRLFITEYYACKQHHACRYLFSNARSSIQTCPINSTSGGFSNRGSIFLERFSSSQW